VGIDSGFTGEGDKPGVARLFLDITTVWNRTAAKAEPLSATLHRLFAPNAVVCCGQGF
jgi:hypothetical protein